MDSLDLEHGLKNAVLSLIGLVAAMLVSYIVQGIWALYRRNKGPTREQFEELTKALQMNAELIGGQKLVTIKMATDIHRIYLFLKVIAGKEWPAFRRQVEEIEKEENLN